MRVQFIASALLGCLTVALAGTVGCAGATQATDERSTVQSKALDQVPVKPVRVVETGPRDFFVDFGTDAFGRLELRLPPPVAGGTVHVRLGEKLAGRDRLDSKPGGSVRYHAVDVTLAPGQTTYVVPLGKNDARRMPAQVGAVMPFRYVELQGLPANVSLQQLRDAAVQQVVVNYPFDDNAADFTCADERVNAVWRLSKHTIKATSFAGLFVDGDRERKPYEADAYIDQLGWYCCTTDVSLPRLTGEYLIQHPTWPTEWVMFSVLIAWDDYQYTGDATSLRACYEDLRAKSLIGLERGDGLISTADAAAVAKLLPALHETTPLKDIVDWPAHERDGYEMRPVNTVVNAFHCRALALMRQIAPVAGHPADAAMFAGAYDRATRSLNASLVDPASGRYVDGEGSTHQSLHANLFPLAFGLVPAERRAAVVAYVRSRGMACSVYPAQFLMDALLDNGEGDAALALMTAPGNRSWRHMVEGVGTTMTLEAWDARYKPNQDWNHAWGAAPANVLPRKVLGVEPLAPGWSRALVWPRAGPGLAWARGRVPTVKGPVTVSWDRRGGAFRMTLDLPAGMTARVGLPGGSGDKPLASGALTMDGRTTPSTAAEGAVFVEGVGPGRHEFVLRGP